MSGMTMTPRLLRTGMNLWPPLIGAGIRVREIADDWSSATVALRHNRFTRNVVGTTFGGSLSAMTDPFYMLLLHHTLGPEYLVWDQAAEIRFVSPGRSDLSVRMELPADVVEAIRADTADGSKSLTWFATTITDADGKAVAEVRRQVYVRRKQPVGAGA
ncbi:DUF4442 domain-containing protein [Gordonia sp. VNK21]|uniref:DUF4442 domain-containing protein n=1 Tax=Gordonia sp. VNK21 TaxID=3382483 RepID=UPI0038D4905C